MNGLFGFFVRRSEVPIEKRDYGKIYLLLAGLLFLGTMWSVLDEVATRRPWKDFQENYYDLSRQKWEDRLKAAEGNFDSTALRAVAAQIQDAEGKLASPDVVRMIREIGDLDEALLDLTRDYTFAKSQGDEAYYFWKKSLHEGSEDKSYERELRTKEAQMGELNSKIEVLTLRRDSLQSIVKEYRNSIKAVRAKEKELYAGIDMAKTRLDRLGSSTVRIRQIMSNNFDRSNFGTPKARIDRCQTCHLGWKDETMADAPQPFTMHPLPDLLKIHTPEVFGCTPCHRGQGPALTPGMAHGAEDHYWEWPLLKGAEVYASCNSCHMNETYLKYGERYNKARQLIGQSGCFGCHEIKGFISMPKIGPQLNQLTVKEREDWLFRWVRNPKDYNPHTRMPNFRFTNEQAEAVTAYLWSIGRASDYRPQKGAAGSADAANGKKLVDQVGCKGCHVIGDDTRMRDERGTSYDMAPELTRVGAKLNPDWTFEWIKNPRAVNSESRMPNLRLTDQEARDIVAYLMNLKDDRQLEVKKLDLDNPEVIKRGEKTIREYGCSGCHAIKGMEKESRVSVSLSNFGRKRVDELDFGDNKTSEIPHSWDEWVFNKIKDARVYVTDRIQSKMPVFAFADSEIVMIRTLLRGYTKELPEEPYQQPFDKRHQDIEAGRRLTHFQYNCIGCHKIEEVGGYIKATLEDEAFAPPYLFPEGNKVQELWLHDFLKAPTTIRPWLNVRMPTFSLMDEEISVISKYFLGLHKQELELRDYRAISHDPRYLAIGKKLFDDLQCLSCHFTGKIPEGKSAADLAPNLTLAKNRLKPDWIVDWIINPEVIQPGTKMPQYYQDLKEPSPYSPDLGGDAKEQIKALRDHVLTISSSK